MRMLPQKPSRIIDTTANYVGKGFQLLSAKKPNANDRHRSGKVSTIDSRRLPE